MKNSIQTSFHRLAVKQHGAARKAYKIASGLHFTGVMTDEAFTRFKVAYHVAERNLDNALKLCSVQPVAGVL